MEDPSDHPAHNSQLSQRRGYDTFIFWPSTPARLFMGLNAKRLGPVDRSQLTRWIAIWDPDLEGVYGHPITICRVRLKEVNPLRYMAEASGSPLELSDAIDPDDYGIFIGTIAESTMTPDPSPHIVDKQSLGKEIERLVARADAGVKYAATKLDLNTMSKEFIAAIKARDPSATCIFTGETANTVISWIFPPALVHKVPCDIHGLGPNAPDYTAPFNAVSMREDLAEHFLANNFGVDVDDNYRIRIFAEPAEDMPPLPDRLHLPGIMNGAMDRFFKLHFRWCLSAKLMGGDIAEDYSNETIRAFEETHCKGGDSDFEVPLSDPTWNSVLGKAVLQDRLKGKLQGVNEGH